MQTREEQLTQLSHTIADAKAKFDAQVDYYIDKFDRDFEQIMNSFRVYDYTLEEKQQSVVTREYKPHTFEADVVYVEEVIVEKPAYHEEEEETTANETSEEVVAEEPVQEPAYIAPASQPTYIAPQPIQTDCPVDMTQYLMQRLYNIRNHTTAASQARYMATHDSEVILANLIVQVLTETDGEEGAGDAAIDLMATTKSVDLEEALAGFDFYEENPYRKQAEKRLAKLERKRRK
ncbi:MAG: hypothetical protein FWE38_01750 [Firmicutes bacterium]|nr:hypothetical protein [Bacillota bacterium]